MKMRRSCILVMFWFLDFLLLVVPLKSQKGVSELRIMNGRRSWTLAMSCNVKSCYIRWPVES